jgi:peptidoglycan/xylan/chitin deacetylase (PgdA/CDA1 family)
MNILHVLSQFELTGAEVHVAALVKEMAKHGHRSFIVSDTLSVPMQATYMSRPIGQRSYLQRFLNIVWLYRFVRKHSIQVIHAHSRAASWVSFFAARLTGTAFVSTIHGRQHVHLSSGLFSIYGRHVIAVCESIKEHLASDLKLKPQEITVIPNGLELGWWNLKKADTSKEGLFGVPQHTKVLLFAGRLSGLKGDVVRFLLSKVVPSLCERQDCIFAIVGGASLPRDIAQTIAAVNQTLGRKTAMWIASQRDVAVYVAEADAIIGSGRVAMEALAMQKPLVSFGESDYLGLITKENFCQATKTNFGDGGRTREPSECSYPCVDPAKVLRDLLESITKEQKESSARELSMLAQQHFDVSRTTARVAQVYRHAFVQAQSPLHIPVLMYHRVIKDPTSGSSCGTWVDPKVFEEQLESIRTRGMSPITFKDYAAFVRGDCALPARPIILTFDDGYEDNYTIAFPMLKKYGFRAVLFVVTSEKERTNCWDPGQPRAQLLSGTQMREMARSGIEFGSHTVSHSDLTAAPVDKVEEELAASKVSLEQTLSAEVSAFAYPYGRLNDRVKQAVNSANYKFAVAADSGPLTFYEDLLEIRRTQVFPWTSRFGFWKKTQPWYWRYKSLLH